MALPLVSVLIPTHNRPAWLARAIRSVLIGGFTDFEIVVSDNGCPEHTRALARQIPDPRIRWLESGHARDALANTRAALSGARGRYVAVLHDDDWWEPSFLDALLPPLTRHPNTVLGFTDHFVVDADGMVDREATRRNSRRWGRTGLSTGFHQPFFELAARQSVPLSASVFRRDAIPEHAMIRSIGPFLDVWLTYLLARSDGAAYYHDERLASRRRHDSNEAAADDLARPLSAIRGRQRMRQDARLREYDDVLRVKLARDHLAAGAMLLRHSRRRAARAHLSASLQMRPSVVGTGALVASWVMPAAALARI